MELILLNSMFSQPHWTLPQVNRDSVILNLSIIKYQIFLKFYYKTKLTSLKKVRCFPLQKSIIQFVYWWCRPYHTWL